MSPLGSTNTKTTQAVTSCGLFVFTPSITITVDRHKRRVNGVVRVLNGNGVNTLKPAVVNGYTLPLSSTNIHRYRCCDARCLFYFYPYILPYIYRFHDGARTIVDAVLTTVFDQNRQTSTQMFYTGVWQDGGHE